MFTTNVFKLKSLAYSKQNKKTVDFGVSFFIVFFVRFFGGGGVKGRGCRCQRMARCQRIANFILLCLKTV